MTRNDRTHIINDTLTAKTNLSPSHLTKQEFGRRLYALMTRKGWKQADLARRAGIPRDAVSKYINGKIFPTRLSLEAVAKALGMTAEELLPNTAENSIEADVPDIEMKISSTTPKVAWLRVNRLVTTTTALKIMELLNDDKPLDAGE